MTCMDAIHLHFSEPGTKPLALTGTVALGWHAGRLQPLTDDAAALVWLHCGARGLWLTRANTAPAVHVNGRQIQRMARLRCGDVLHVGQSELRLLGPPPQVPDASVPDPALPAPDTTTDADSADPRVLLRAVGGADHGRAFPLHRPLLVGRSTHADIRIDDPTFAEQHARLESVRGQVVLHDLGSSEGSLVNGHAVRDAVLGDGDQIVFATHARFVLGIPTAPQRAPAPATLAEAPPPSPPARQSHPVWLLLAAAALAAGLVLLLMFGSR